MIDRSVLWLFGVSSACVLTLLLDFVFGIIPIDWLMLGYVVLMALPLVVPPLGRLIDIPPVWKM